MKFSPKLLYVILSVISLNTSQLVYASGGSSHDQDESANHSG